MSDNFIANAPTTTGNTFASDDIAGVHYSRIKISHGADGSATDSSDAAPFPVKLVPLATGGATLWRSTLDLDETEEEVKSTAGTIYGLLLTNRSTAARYFKLYNATAASTTVGTTPPMATFCLEGSQSADIAFPVGIAFSTALSIAVTTGYADNDTGAPTANDCWAHVLYA